MNNEVIAIKDKFTELKLEYSNLPRGELRRTTFLDIIDKSYDENFISDYLAFILNPNKNGIGTKPLLLVLSEHLETSDYSFKNISIKREYTISNRRLDIIIDNPDENLLIVIENKINSQESFNQTKEYAKYINKAFPERNSILLFLAPYSSNKLSSDEFKSMTYTDLYEKLNQISINEFSEIDSFKFFQDFLVHIKNKLLKSKTIMQISEKTKLYIENKALINDLSSAYEKDASELFNYIVSITKKHFDKIEEAAFILSFNGDRGYQQITKKEWNLTKLNIHYEWLQNKKSFFSKTSLPFFIDVEGNNKEIFFKCISNENISEIENNDFHFRYPRRPRTVIYKEFKLHKPLYQCTTNEIDNFFNEVYEKSTFAIKIIETALAQYKLL